MTAAVAAAADVVGADQARRKAEEGMDGLAADVDRGEPRGRHDHHLVGDEIAQAPQQRRFAGAGAPRDEQVTFALAQKVMGGEKFGRGLHAGGPMRRRGGGGMVAAGKLVTYGSLGDRFATL